MPQANRESRKAASQGLARRLPDYALRVLAALEEQGFEAWVVGGWVRDVLRGASPHDVDIATNAEWRESQRALCACGIEVHETGTAHGTVTAVVAGQPVEVTTYRTEGSYSDHRHPDEVRFVGDVRADLARRDFTINAMAYHPVRGLLDPFGGKDDLARGIVRAVGNPSMRFEEDALRVLRAVRFAARFGFTVEPVTQLALVAAAPELAYVSYERVGQELRGIVSSGHLAWALAQEREVMQAALPALGASFGPAPEDGPSRMQGSAVTKPNSASWEHVVRRCQSVEELCAGMPAEPLRWAALLFGLALAHGVRGARLDGRVLSREQLLEQRQACCEVEGQVAREGKEQALVARVEMECLALPRPLLRETYGILRLTAALLGQEQTPVAQLLAEAEHLVPGHAARVCLAAFTLAQAEALAKGHDACTLPKTKVNGAAQPAYAHSRLAPARAHASLDALNKAAMGLRHALSEGICWRVADLAISGGDLLALREAPGGPWVGELLECLLAAVGRGEVSNERAALLALARRSLEELPSEQ